MCQKTLSSAFLAFLYTVKLRVYGAVYGPAVSWECRAYVYIACAVGTATVA
jgi:hypothetical protein